MGAEGPFAIVSVAGDRIADHHNQIMWRGRITISRDQCAGEDKAGPGECRSQHPDVFHLQ
jgi:hypothetical protein